jgi:hypothetical protein
MVNTVLNRIKTLTSRNLANKNAINKDLYRLLVHPEFLELASMSRMSPETMEIFRSSLRNQTFQFCSVRQKPPIHEVILQQAMLRIMEAIYPSPFISSFEGTNYHSTLHEIQQKWVGAKWAVDGDMKGCFDNINHNILVDLLRRKIQDERFLNLIWKLLRVGYSKTGLVTKPTSGISQSGFLSPILATIYLHELDRYADCICNQYPIDFTLRKTSPKIVPLELTPLFGDFQVKYVRYADHWIMAVRGSKQIALEIQNKMETFLYKRLELHLLPKTDRVTHLLSQNVLFMGYTISMGKKKWKSGRTMKHQLRLQIPINYVVMWLAKNNFCSLNGNPRRKNGWIKYPDEIIVQRYNSILHGLQNYYAPADNLATSMHRIQYVLTYSCAHTLASKHRTRISIQLPQLQKSGLGCRDR